jgi:arylformamidase
VRLLVGEHYNHFELPETLCNPYGLLRRAALDLMGLDNGSLVMPASAYDPR